MTAPLADQDRNNLIVLNNKIGEAQLHRQEAFLQRLLADELQFCRAPGVVVGKGDYSHSDGFQVFAVGDEVVVSLLVWAKGVRDKSTLAPKPFSGVCRNIRIFRRDSGSLHRWLCHFWFNDQVVV